MRVLALGCYPIKRPVHGGQRRIAAIQEGYRQRGIPYSYVSAFDKRGFSERDRDENDLIIGCVEPRYDRVWQLADFRAGLFASSDEVTFKSLLRLARDFQPTHVQLEQIYLYPIFERMRALPETASMRLIYSSQNVECHMKRVVLESAKLPQDLTSEVVLTIENWERAAVQAADLVLTSSFEDAEVYRGWGAKKIVVCRNGVGDFPEGELPPRAARILQGNRFLLTVGSGHPPNISGFLELVANPAVVFGSGRPLIVICGGMAHEVVRHQRFREAVGFGDGRFVAMPAPNDAQLGALKRACHGFILPILSGGGSNLKTAEALISGKYIVTTRFAFRGFEEFMSARGITLADNPREFKDAINRVLLEPPLEITEEERIRRQQVRWEHTLTAFFARILEADRVPE